MPNKLEIRTTDVLALVADLERRGDRVTDPTVQRRLRFFAAGQEFTSVQTVDRILTGYFGRPDLLHALLDEQGVAA